MIDHLQSILTQDCACTSNPIFLVLGHRRIATNPDFDDSDPVYVNMSTRDHEEISEKEYDELNYLFEAGEEPLDSNGEKFDPNDWERLTFIWVEEFNQAFFTRAAAEEYLARNNHRIPGVKDGKPAVIYVDSAYRNKEWQDIRKFLIDKAQVESNSVSI